MGLVQNADTSKQPIFGKYVSPSDWPWAIALMVSESRRILSYMEHVPEEAMPPESIWHSAHKCTEWIKEHHPLLKDKPGSGMLEFSDEEVEKKT